MTREEAKKIVKALPTGLHAQTSEDKKSIRAIVAEFGIGGVSLRGKCPNCWQDAVYILRNHFGITAGDTEGDGKPDAQNGWRYLRREPMRWNGHIIDATTDPDVIAEFVKYHPQFFEAVKDETEEDGGGK